MKKLTLLSIVAASALFAGGYKIPEVSTNGVALSAANVAHSTSADAAYYNPANMIFMYFLNSLEMDLQYIGLDAIHFKGSGSQAGDSISAEKETFLVPSINYVSPKLGNVRVGLSIVVPGGLSKRWNDSPAKDKAQEFTLEVVEINPTVAYAVNDTLAVAAGFRIVHSTGVVKSSAAISRDMSGDSFDYGYNIALAYKPTKTLDIGVTYRSNVDLTEEGTAKLYSPTGLAYDGGSSVTVPLPALLNLAIAYTFKTNTTVEFVYERNFWSSYKTLDFDYAANIGNLTAKFADPIAKDWEDTNAFRLGITQALDGMTFMAGMVYDKSPVPDAKLSYELPDSDSLSVSFGGRFDVTKDINIGLSALYSMRDDRTVNNADIEGTFSNSNVLIVSAGLGYKF